MARIALIMAFLIISSHHAAWAGHLEVGGHHLEAASTDCGDNTQVFVAGQDSPSPGVYVFKNGYLVFSSAGEMGMGVGMSVVCTKQGIFIHGESPAYYTLDAIVNEGGKLTVKDSIGGGRKPSDIVAGERETRILTYGDDRTGNDDMVVDEQVLTGNFTIPEDAPKTLMAVKAKHLSPASKKEGLLTALSTCYNEKFSSEYTVSAYETQDHRPMVDIAYSDALSTAHNLEFVATNSICADGDTYLFGKDGQNTPRAAEIHYDSGTKQFAITAIKPESAPLRPYGG